MGKRKSSVPQLPPASHDHRVRCAGGRIILNVKQGVMEFLCPTCKMRQMLPPELMGLGYFKNRRPRLKAHGIDPSKLQLPCAQCRALLNVPYGLSRFACPQCGVDLVVDVSKLPRRPPPDTISKN